MKRFLLKSVGFIFAFLLTLAIEIGLVLLLSELLDRRLMPRGPAWLAIPVIVGIAAARRTPEFIAALPAMASRLSQRFREASTLGRFLVVGPIFWVLAVAAFVFLFEPYGYTMYSEDYEHMLKVMLFPPALLWSGYWVYQKFIRRDEGSDNKSIGYEEDQEAN